MSSPEVILVDQDATQAEAGGSGVRDAGGVEGPAETVDPGQEDRDRSRRIYDFVSRASHIFL